MSKKNSKAVEVIEAPVRKARRSPKRMREGNVTEKEEAAYQEAKARAKKGDGIKVTSLFNLNPETTRKIEGMAYRQVQTTSQLTKTNEKVDTLAANVAKLAAAVESQLARIRVATADPEHPVFATRCFNKISIRLKKRTVDVIIEDIHQGAKRRRLFRCDSFGLVEHLLTMRTVVPGIEESALVRRTKAKAKPKQKAPSKRNKKPQSIADIRYEMERDGIPNAIIPQTKNKYYDAEKATRNATENRTREKAEQVIIKLCSPGAQLEGVTDERLVDALVETGFEPPVAFAAASNCGRITKKGLEKRYSVKAKTTAGQSNEY